MEQLKELQFEKLSVEQKLGMVLIGTIIEVREHEVDKYGTFEENVDFVIDLIRNHSLGAVWIGSSLTESRPDIMQRIHDAADYPILVFTDAERGIGKYRIGCHNAIGVADSEELAYTFGKVTAVTARKMGYNVVCDPVLDLSEVCTPCGGPNRGLGGDKHRVARLAAAVARGMHDGGVLTVAKHYPGVRAAFDTHMAPFVSDAKLEDIIDYQLYPYKELCKEGLLDGVMKGHIAVASIDQEYPTSVSMKASQLLRSLGFDGFFLTDALDMMGLRAKYGDTNLKGLGIAGGNEFVLPWFSAKKAYLDLVDCYKRGLFTDERLDDATRRVLEAQHKANLMRTPKYSELTDEDIRLFNEINNRSVYQMSDDGVVNSISKNGKHYFAVMVPNAATATDDGKLVDPNFSYRWYTPQRIIDKIKETFPSSDCRVIYEHPTPRQNADVLSYSLGCEDVVFVTYADAPPSAGSERFTPRFLALMGAMQVTGRITTLLHFGSPFALDEVPHISRRLIGGVNNDSMAIAVDILAGEKEPLGHPTYKVALK